MSFKEVLTTGADGIVQVRLDDGHLIDFGRDYKIALDVDVLGFEGDAPGAGGAEGGGSHEPVVLAQADSSGPGTSGYPTAGASIGFPSPEIALGIVEAIAPAVTVVKSAVSTIAEGGADVTYRFVITASVNNASTDPMTVSSIVDNKLGDLTAVAIAANGGNPIVLNPGELFEFN